MSKLIESGDLQYHIFNTLQPAYARRYRSMISAINEFLLPLGVILPQTDRAIVGGYFIWLTLPARISANKVSLRAKEEENLIIAEGPLFGVYGDALEDDLQCKVRICFSWEEEENLAEGIKRLGQVIRRMQSEDRHKQGTSRSPANGGISVKEYQ